MLIEADLVAECLVANVTSERPLAVVRTPGVHFQTVRSRKHFLTFDAGKISTSVVDPAVAASVGIASIGAGPLMKAFQSVRMLRMVLWLESARVEHGFAGRWRLLLLRRRRRQTESERVVQSGRKEGAVSQKGKSPTQSVVHPPTVRQDVVVVHHLVIGRRFPDDDHFALFVMMVRLAQQRPDTETPRRRFDDGRRRRRARRVCRFGNIQGDGPPQRSRLVGRMSDRIRFFDQNSIHPEMILL